MIIDWILAGSTVAVVAVRPRSGRGAALAACLAAADLAPAGTASLGPALRATLPMLALLGSALALAGLAVRLGLTARMAAALGAASAGSALRLYVLVCALCAALTACLSLDGAVVLMARIVLELRRRFGAPSRPLLLGVVAVANAFSPAVPLGNPTNLVVIERLGLGLGSTTARLLPAAAAAAIVCAGLVALVQRRRLSGDLQQAPAPASAHSPPSAPAGLAGAIRIGVQVLALLVVLLPVVPAENVGAAGLRALLAVSLVISVLAAVVNNLPASAVVAAALAPGPPAYAALIGLSIGALALPQGSVATLIVGDLAGESPHERSLTPIALAGAAAATLVMWSLRA